MSDYMNPIENGPPRQYGIFNESLTPVPLPPVETSLNRIIQLLYEIKGILYELKDLAYYPEPESPEIEEDDYQSESVHEHATPVDFVNDTLAVFYFSKAMIEKLHRAKEKGREGWQNMSAEELTRGLMEHLLKGDPIDVANYAMFLHQTDNKIDTNVVNNYINHII
jgi:hypothetical protein